MKKLVFILIFIYLLSYVNAQDDIFYRQSLLLNIKAESDFNLKSVSEDSYIDFVKAQFYFFPIDDFHQNIIDIQTDPEAKIRDDNIEFIWNNPSIKRHDYSITSEVRTFNKFMPVKQKISFPIRVKDEELKEYIKESPKIDITDDIILQASEIVSGEDDLFEVVFKLATWTKHNINYSLDTLTADASQKSSWVLKNRYGVCDEMTNLFIAMNRALGIPARFVSGLSYTNSDLFKERWGLHGWAEVYFPEYGWISFDPTYGQYGHIDPSHVKLRDSIDSDKSSTNFTWRAQDVNLKTSPLDFDVNILEQSNKVPNYIELNLVAYTKEVDIGSYNLVEAKLKNKKDYYIGFELTISKPVEVEIMGNNKKYILLKPNEEKSIYWIVKVNDKLNKNYIYTFPLEAINSLGYSFSGSFKSSSRSVSHSYAQIAYLYNQFIEQDEKVFSRNLDINCNMPSAVYINENFAVNCQIANEGNIFLEDLNICMESQCRRENIGISQTKQVVFTGNFEKSGNFELIVRAKNKDVNSFKTLSMIVEDMPDVSIENIVFPEIIEYGPEFDIDFEIYKNSISKPKNISVLFTFNNKVTNWHIDKLESNQKFNIKIDKTLINPNSNEFTIAINYHDMNNVIYSDNFEKELILKNPGFFNNLILWLNKLSRSVENYFQR